MKIHIKTTIRQSLKSLGFSENEIKIITYLFSVKKTSLKNISQNTALSFSITHFSLSNLTVRGIVECLQGEPDDLYQIISKNNFLEWIDNQKQQNLEIYDKAKNQISDFLQEMTKDNWKPEVKYYEGKEGIIELYEDMLEAIDTNGEIFSWLDIDKITEYIGDYLYEYIKKRQDKNIKSHDIVPENEINRKHELRDENREIRFIKTLPINGDIRIFKNKVAVVAFNEEHPVGFVFEGEVIVSLFKTIFKSQWNSLKSSD
jgi:sugar-specific transcriptional regulator TrmB